MYFYMQKNSIVTWHALNDFPIIERLKVCGSEKMSQTAIATHIYFKPLTLSSLFIGNKFIVFFVFFVL